MLVSREPLILEKYRRFRSGWRKFLGVYDRRREAALATLTHVYSSRADLQEVFPEAKAGDLARLINWAAGVASNNWKDGSYDVLSPHLDWYRDAKTVDVEMPIPWATALVTSEFSSNPMPTTLRVMQEGCASDISNHLIMLSLLLHEFGLRNVVELGTRDGNSTLALLEAARNIGGHVTSVDIDVCLLARERVEAAGLTAFWTFLQADDMQLSPPQIPELIDLLFIDTSHLYTTTMAELNKYAEFLRDGAWIALHDYVSFPGVSRAVQDFTKSFSRRGHFYPFLHQNGLALLRVGQVARL